MLNRDDSINDFSMAAYQSNPWWMLLILATFILGIYFFPLYPEMEEEEEEVEEGEVEEEEEEALETAIKNTAIFPHFFPFILSTLFYVFAIFICVSSVSRFRVPITNITTKWRSVWMLLLSIRLHSNRPPSGKQINHLTSTLIQVASYLRPTVWSISIGEKTRKKQFIEINQSAISVSEHSQIWKEKYVSNNNRNPSCCAINITLSMKWTSVGKFGTHSAILKSSI